MRAASAGDCCSAARPDLSGSAQPQRAAPTMSARAARGAALEAATRAAEDSPSATDLSDYEGRGGCGRRAPRQRAAAPARCSRNAPPTLLIAPAEPGPEGVPGACQLWSGSETAAQACRQAACELPAAAALRAAGALSPCQRLALSARALWLQLHPYSCIDQTAVSVRCTGMFGGAGGAGRGVGWVHTRGWWSDLNGRQVLSF